MSSEQNQENSASMLKGHAIFAKGYVEETVGNVTGSREWQESGKRDASAGIQEMKAANTNKTDPTPSSLGGKIEQMVGSATGCVGMEEEGKERVEKAAN